MNINKYNKILPHLLLAIFILFIIIILIKLRNLSVSNPDIVPGAILIFVITLIILLMGIFTYFVSKKLLEKIYLDSIEKDNLHKKINAQKEIKEKIATPDTDVSSLKITGEIIPGEKANENIEKFAEELLINISKIYEIAIGIMYIREAKSDIFKSVGTYAYYSDEKPKSFATGESLTGQAVKNKQILNLSELPDNYIAVLSGLGQGNPKNLLIVPVLFKNEVISIIELASFKRFNQDLEGIFSDLAKKISEKLNKFIK